MFAFVCFSVIFVPVSTSADVCASLENPFCKPLQGQKRRASRLVVVLYAFREANIFVANGRSEKLQS